MFSIGKRYDFLARCKINYHEIINVTYFDDDFYIAVHGGDW